MSNILLAAIAFIAALGVPGLAHAQSECWSGAEKSGAFCYPKCNPGYEGAGPVCWGSCPPGSTNDGATCRKDVSIIGANNDRCPVYDKCGLTLSKGCSTCPAGYKNDGCTCRLDVSIVSRPSYGRGALRAPGLRGKTCLTSSWLNPQRFEPPQNRGDSDCQRSRRAARPTNLLWVVAIPKK